MTADAALDALITRGRALVAALDADDAGAIDAETETFRTALANVQAGGEIRDAHRASEAFAVVEAARVRVAVLADVTHARLRRIAAMTGRERAQTYGRRGRLRA